jgi:tol-pal system protein YbgF
MHKRRGAALTTAAVVALLGSGCYGKRISAVEVRTARIEDRLNEIERAQRDQAAEVAELREKVRAQVDLVRAGHAGGDERMRDLERAVQILAQRVDESGELYRELKDTVRYRAADSTAAASGGGGGGGSPRAIYDAAYQDLTRGNHGLAILGFQEVLAKFPTSELADNAQYWIGESYYAQKDFKQALAEFQKTVQAYPQGDKVPAALYKTALCQQQLGDKGAARTTLQGLVDKYPQSEEARLARSKIQEL